MHAGGRVAPDGAGCDARQGRAAARRRPPRRGLCRRTRDTVERERIVDVLRTVAGNKQAAARILGVSRRAFYRRLERYGLHTASPMAPGGPGTQTWESRRCGPFPAACFVRRGVRTVRPARSAVRTRGAPRRGPRSRAQT